MSERFSQPSNVVARGLNEPLADAAMNARTLLLRNLASGSSPYQVMREAKHPRRFDGDTTPDELTRRPLSASFVPAAELGRVRERERARGDRRSASSAAASALAPRRRAVTSRPASVSTPSLRTRASSQNGDPADLGDERPRRILAKPRCEFLHELKHLPSSRGPGGSSGCRLRRQQVSKRFSERCCGRQRARDHNQRERIADRFAARTR